MNVSIDRLESKLHSTLDPIHVLGEIALDSGEKMMELQMESCRAYSDIGLSQIKKLSSIRSLEQAGDFTWGQIEPIGQINKQVLADLKSVAAINSEFTTEVKSVFSKEQADKKATGTLKSKSAKSA